MSSDARPEFFLDRSLGKTTARHLREHDIVVHLIADHYEKDAQEVPDEVWIAEGCRRGWVLLTKDKRIRYRAEELSALDGQLFCLAGGSATIAEMTERILSAMPAIERAVSAHRTGFWHIYASGSIRLMWPPPHPEP